MIAKERTSSFVKQKEYEERPRIDAEAIKERTDLRDLAMAVTTLRRESTGKKGEIEMSGPCPKCDGKDRFHVQKDRFFCRQCFPFVAGRTHDVFVFLEWMYGYSFLESVAYLTGGAAPVITGAAKRTPGRNQKSKQNWNAERAEKLLQSEQAALWDEASKSAHSFLLGRGLTPDT